jgi:hypothetical protein
MKFGANPKALEYVKGILKKRWEEEEAVRKPLPQMSGIN